MKKEYFSPSMETIIPLKDEYLFLNIISSHDSEGWQAGSVDDDSGDEY